MGAAQTKQLKTYFQQNNEVELVILFGSMATENYTAKSDIDVAILQNEPITALQKKNLIENIALIIGRPVDLIDLQKVGEPLLGQVLKYGKRLLGSNKQYAELALKHVYAQADFMPYVERTLKERRDKWLSM